MSNLKLTKDEEKLIIKYQQTHDTEIALYFFNKVGQDLLGVIYSKINSVYTNIPFEKEDLTSIVWKGINAGLKIYKNNDCGLWNVWVNRTYALCINEIKKYFKNTELILNYADSWDDFQNKHCVYNVAKSSIDFPKQSFKTLLQPIVDYVSEHNKTYGKRDLRVLLTLKSMGFSEREIAEKMHISRRYVRSMLKVITRISKNYFKH